MPMTAAEINTIYEMCQDQNTGLTPAYGQAVQFPTHAVALRRTRFYDAGAIAVWQGANPDQDYDGVVMGGAVASQADRALAMCMVGINDEILDITANRGAGGTRVADGVALDALDLNAAGAGPLNSLTVANWVAANPALVAQARIDIDTLSLFGAAAAPLVALGGGIAQEAIARAPIDVMLANSMDTTSRAEAAINRMLTGRAIFDAIPDLAVRRAGLVREKNGIGALAGLLPGEGDLYRRALEVVEIAAVDVAIVAANAAARTRFAATDLVHFAPQTTPQLRLNAVVAQEALALGAPAALDGEEPMYREMLRLERVRIEGEIAMVAARAAATQAAAAKAAAQAATAKAAAQAAAAAKAAAQAAAAKAAAQAAAAKPTTSSAQATARAKTRKY